MDFLGLTTLTLIDDALKLIEKRHGVKLVLEDLPLDDPEGLRDLLQGLHQRRFPVRIARHARHSAPLSAEPHRRSHRAQRALPARPHSGRHARRLHRAQARAQGDQSTILPELKRASRRNLWRDPLSGTGDADFEPHRRILAGRRRSAAPRHGQEEGGRDGEAARALRQRRARARPSRRRRSKRFST